MPAKKSPAKATPDSADEPAKEQQIAYDDGSGPEPGDINSSLDSDRMKALLEEHRAMGSRP